jgi:hypothetical protein
VEQVYEEEANDEEVQKGKMKKIRTEVEEKFQQVPPKTPRKRVQKNHPSDQIIGNKDAGVETRRRICSPEQLHLHSYLRLNQTVLKRPARMNSGKRP